MLTLIDCLYPAVCPICDSIRRPTESVCCDTCYEKLSPVGNCTCFQCGKPVADESVEFCFDCAKKPRSFERGYAAFMYEDVIRESMMGFKFLDKPWRGTFFASEFVKMHGSDIEKHRPEILVPVPLHPRKMRDRGYNQAGILAEEIGRLLGIPVNTKLLRRNRSTVAQKKLNDVERLRNLREAFSVNEKEAARILPMLRNKTVLLVDDIYTTGSTMEACTRVLMDCGMKHVVCGTICIGSGY